MQRDQMSIMKWLYSSHHTLKIRTLVTDQIECTEIALIEKKEKGVSRYRGDLAYHQPYLITLFLAMFIIGLIKLFIYISPEPQCLFKTPDEACPHVILVYDMLFEIYLCINVSIYALHSALLLHMRQNICIWTPTKHF